MRKKSYRKKFSFWTFLVESEVNQPWIKKYYLINKKGKKTLISSSRFDEALKNAVSYTISYADAYFYKIKRYKMKFLIQ
ncbi:hypothetical protein FIA58_009125 [Flavobacterium jejuense]|uniref:Uncharacterized protein n=1 Tax=Flavobacterium jejuense TaxID=1544455 RepID=A0ABX0ISQ3_9FLAO|nr:hypothetical protein [Flavobacterium jejuense]NHN25834.1 hypothetical protein [Flavobacterium jejuense]